MYCILLCCSISYYIVLYCVVLGLGCFLVKGSVPGWMGGSGRVCRDWIGGTRIGAGGPQIADRMGGRPDWVARGSELGGYDELGARMQTNMQT